MAFRFICPYCSTETEIDDALKGVQQECPACCEKVVFEPSTEKKCPHCDQVIKINAKICRFCHKSVYTYKYRLSDLMSVLTKIKNQTVDEIIEFKNIIIEKYKTFNITNRVDTVNFAKDNTATPDEDNIVKIDPASLFPASYITTDPTLTTASDSLENADTPFEFECPNCHNLLEAEQEYIGMETECPVCNTTIIIPPPTPPQAPVKSKRTNKIIITSIIGVSVVAAIACIIAFCQQTTSVSVNKTRMVNVTVNIQMKKIIPIAYLDYKKYSQIKDAKYKQKLMDEKYQYNINIYLINDGKLGAPIHTETNVAYDYKMKDGVDIKVSIPQGEQKIFATMQLTDEFRQMMRDPMNRTDVVLCPAEVSYITADTDGKKVSVVCDRLSKI